MTKENHHPELDSKQERQKIINEINDMAYLGPIRDIINGMKSNECKEHIDDVTKLWNRAIYLRDLVNLSFKKIDETS